MTDDLNADECFAQLRDLQEDGASAAGIASFSAPLPPLPMPDALAPVAGDLQMPVQQNVTYTLGSPLRIQEFSLCPYS